MSTLLKRAAPGWSFPILLLFLSHFSTVRAHPVDEPVIRLSRSGDPRAVIEVIGLDRSWLSSMKGRFEEALRVATIGTEADLPSLFGSYTIDDGILRFRPRFPLEPGVRYRAVLTIQGRRPITMDFAQPRKDPGAPAEVSKVYPSRDLLPENLLKFYIEFSKPMSRGEAYEHIHLLDAAGKPIEHAFLELGEELWDPRGVRFTLLFDPGRIKKGLRPREDLGPVLEAGKSYTLVIDKDWRDADRNPLRAELRKPFRAGPADETPPDPKTWTIEPPPVSSRQALVARFPEPLDRALLTRTISVRDATGRLISGTVAVGREETSWSFTPDDQWKAGTYELVVDRTLEDLCGNGIGRPFEVDVFRRIDRSVAADSVSLRFSVGRGE
jgi:hypothetical protein